MPVYTVLGGTGATDGAVIKALANSSSTKNNITTRVYVRSKNRLHQKLPFIANHPSTTVIEGSLDDNFTLASCLRDADVIFSCIATNSSEPGTNIALSTAAAIIFTLQQLRSTLGNAYKAPTVLVLTSMSVNTALKGHPARPIQAIIHTALHYLYEDLHRAQQLYCELEHRDPGLLKVIFIQPPAILPAEKATGYRLSTTEGGGAVSFADLGYAMVEVAERKEDFAGKGVTVVSTGFVAQNWRGNAKALAIGLFAYFFPTVWGMGRGLSWW